MIVKKQSVFRDSKSIYSTILVSYEVQVTASLMPFYLALGTLVEKELAKMEAEKEQNTHIEYFPGFSREKS